jgi:hypothetical protein
MSGNGTFRVEPTDLQRTAEQIERIATSLGHSLRGRSGVQHAQNAADSPEVAAAMVAMVEAWGTDLANLTAFVTAMASKLASASASASTSTSTCYVSTDAMAADWAQLRPSLSPQFAPR